MERDKNGRFVEGNEGGPGRPKGSLDILTAIRRKLEQCPDGDKRTLLDQLIDKYILHVLEEMDGVAIRDLIDRFNGKPKQTVQISNDKDAEWLNVFRDIKNEVIRETADDSDRVDQGSAEDTDT